ncbi:MAG TPA: hypothetical protein VLD55_07155 [Candidatus Sulfobium mesophilum]|nr:hypothetical protein [Candidatus Sulfobium mesophilum]
MISVSIIGMEARRCITLFQAISGETTSELRPRIRAGRADNVGIDAGRHCGNLSPLIAVKEAEEKQKNLVARLQEALAKIRTLSGILSICASCKKIRDDRGCWNQVDAYIRDHSEAEFSHSICPDCAKKLDPDYFRKDRPSR